MKKVTIFFLFFILSMTTVISQDNTIVDMGQNRYTFAKGDKQINLAGGFLNTTDFAFSLFGASGSGDPSPSLNLEFDYGLTDHISFGMFTSFYKVDAHQTSSLGSIADGLGDIGLGQEANDILDQLGLGDVLCQTLGIGCPESELTNIQERINVLSIGGKLMYRRPLIPELDTYVSTYLGYSFNKRKTLTEAALDGVAQEVGLDTEVPSIIYFGSLGVRYYATKQLGVYGEYGTGNVHLLKAGITYRLL